jgi:hypothetical protein
LGIQEIKVPVFSRLSAPLRTGRLYPHECSWYSFLEAESTPGHMISSVASEKIAIELQKFYYLPNVEDFGYLREFSDYLTV